MSLGEPAPTEQAGVAAPAGGAGGRRIVATSRHSVVHAQRQAPTDDLRLGLGKDVGHGNLAANLLCTGPLRHVDLGSQRQAAESPRIQIYDGVSRTSQRPRNPPGGIPFDRMPLSIPNADPAGLETLALGDRRAGR